MPREVIIAGNWKMHMNSESASEYFTQFSSAVLGSSNGVYLAVPFTLISLLANRAQGSNILIGAQNMHDAESGAFTGEVSASMLQDAGASFVILGHSERRHIFGESSAFVNAKAKKALMSNLQPIVCIGETQEQREAGDTEKVLEQQLAESLADLSPEQLENVVLAYEPVWAIGTGLTATPEQAQETHAFCRRVFLKTWNETVAQGISILYGGSVKPDNAKAIMEQEDVDGVLVGGASLKPDVFAQIVNFQTIKV